MDTIKVGDEFFIHVLIKNAQNVFGVAVSLNYPLDVISISTNEGSPVITKGGFLGEESQVLPGLSLNQGNNTGTLLIGYSLNSGGVPEKSGEGRMFTIKAKALKAGSHKLSWSTNSVVQNSESKNQPARFDDFELNVENNEGQINIVYIEIGKTSSPA